MWEINSKSDYTRARNESFQTTRKMTKEPWKPEVKARRRMFSRKKVKREKRGGSVASICRRRRLLLLLLLLHHLLSNNRRSYSRLVWNESQFWHLVSGSNPAQAPFGSWSPLPWSWMPEWGSQGGEEENRGRGRKQGERKNTGGVEENRGTGRKQDGKKPKGLKKETKGGKKKSKGGRKNRGVI